MVLVSRSLAVVAAVNDDEVLAANLAASPCLRNEEIPLVIERGRDSAGQAYNAGLDRTTAEIVVFAHQDVYLPRGWEQKLLLAIKTLEREKKDWAVLGIVGAEGNGNLVGKAWSTGLRREVGTDVVNPSPIVSVDELVIVLRKITGLRFDSNLPGFHLYGADIVQLAIKGGFEACVFHGPVVHNSLPAVQLGRPYSRAYKYMQKKWQSNLPLYTTVMPITRLGWPLLRNQLSSRRKSILKQIPARQQHLRHNSPWHIAQELGYEYKEF